MKEELVYSHETYIINIYINKYYILLLYIIYSYNIYIILAVGIIHSKAFAQPIDSPNITPSVLIYIKVK